MSGPPAATGYLHPAYAASLAEFGEPRELPLAQGHLLRRRIPATGDHDAMGCYPIFCCRRWDLLGRDLEGLAESLVSVSLVADPFGSHTEEMLRGCFDVVRPFKDHFVADLAQEGAGLPRARHRRNLARAQRSVAVDTCLRPLEHLDEWLSLYAHLAARTGLSGMRAFSRRSFEQQLAVPGLVMFRARAGGTTVGLHLWFVLGEVAYGHLGATSARGHELAASYALYAHAVQELKKRVRWLDLGGSAGLSAPTRADGLARFKEGWSTGTRTAWLCGRILQKERYHELAEARGAVPDAYFPAYRQGEFASAAAGQEAAV